MYAIRFQRDAHDELKALVTLYPSLREPIRMWFRAIRRAVDPDARRKPSTFERLMGELLRTLESKLGFERNALRVYKKPFDPQLEDTALWLGAHFQVQHSDRLVTLVKIQDVLCMRRTNV